MPSSCGSTTCSELEISASWVPDLPFTFVHVEDAVMQRTPDAARRNVVYCKDPSPATQGRSKVSPHNSFFESYGLGFGFRVFQCSLKWW